MPKGCNRLCSDSYVYLEEGVAHCFQVDVPILYASLFTSMRGRPLPPNRDQVHRICKQVKLERVTTGVEGGEEDERPSKGGECSEADCHWQYCVGVTGLLFLA